MSKQQPRKSRKAQRQEQVAREKRRRLLFMWVPIGIVAAIVVGYGLFLLLRPEIEGVERVSSAIANQHDQSLVIGFGGLPPTGGPHNPVWQNCGIYTIPVEPQFAIHSMEHGAVWITYQPGLALDQVEELQAKVRGQSYLLLSPYPDQEVPIAMTTWTRQLTLEDSGDERIDEFIRRYRGQGPEQGALCSGGQGNPQ